MQTKAVSEMFYIAACSECPSVVHLTVLQSGPTLLGGGGLAQPLSGEQMPPGIAQCGTGQSYRLPDPTGSDQL